MSIFVVDAMRIFREPRVLEVAAFLAGTIIAHTHEPWECPPAANGENGIRELDSRLTSQKRGFCTHRVSPKGIRSLRLVTLRFHGFPSDTAKLGQFLGQWKLPAAANRLDHSRFLAKVQMFAKDKGFMGLPILPVGMWSSPGITLFFNRARRGSNGHSAGFIGRPQVHS